jgi:O-antigen ligase
VRAAAAAFLLVGAPVFVLTQSRGAWLALGGALGLLAVMQAARNLRAASPAVLAGAAAAVLVALALAVPLAAYTAAALGGTEPTGVAAAGERLAGRITGGGSQIEGLSSGGRIALWREAADLVRERPLTGIGLHSFPLVHGRLPEYGDAFVYKGLPHAHNTLLQAALDYGIPGLAAVAGVYAAGLWTGWRAIRRTAGTPLEPLAIGLLFGLVAHGLHGVVDAVAIGAKPGFLVWAFAGLLAGVRFRAAEWTPGSGEWRPLPPADRTGEAGSDV